MNISYKWLKEYVDFDLNAQELADALTSIGLEVDGVEEVESIRGGLKGLVVGHILSCEPHPDSDHMHVCRVDLGSASADGPVQVVCGAPNVAAGQKVVVATIGTKLYDGDNCFTIKRSKLRGVESFGMICAEDEIGVGLSHDGIIVLPADTPVGMEAASYYGVESDYCLEVDITPNRADACSHYGVARDLAAWLRRQGKNPNLRRPAVEAFKVDNHDLPIQIRVEAKEACPRYCAVSLKNCEVKESPRWLRERLEAIGLRPINNIVDITNYLMMAYGQPLHCFDADKVEGREVIVKTLPDGTKFQTLDGNEHTLSERDLAICDQHGPMCIAGVMGGRGSGTYETTRDVLLESAYFHPTWIRKSARRHGLSTDASFRFERGVDPDGQIYALKMAALLAKELAGAEVAMEIVDVEQPGLAKSFEVKLNYSYVNALIGTAIPADDIKQIVHSLEMEIVGETPEGLDLKVPAYRVDVQRPCDVVEDILRIYGYNHIEIPSAVKSSLTVKGEHDFSYKLENLIGEQLVGEGFREILNNSLTREAYYSPLKTYDSDHLVRVMNPLSSDLNVLRQTLLFGGLESISHNVNRRLGNLRFFEVGNTYRFERSARTEERPLRAYTQTHCLALWLTGMRVQGSWAHPDEASDVFQLKAALYNILRRLGVSMERVRTESGDNDIFSKSLCLRDVATKSKLAEFGLVSRAVLASVDIDQDVCYAELDWDVIMKCVSHKHTTFAEIPKFPSVSRDLALLVDNGVKFEEIEMAAQKAGGKLLRSVRLFDVYEGSNLPAGKKSYAINLTLQDLTRTMNDKQTDATMQRIVAAISKQTGATLR